MNNYSIGLMIILFICIIILFITLIMYTQNTSVPSTQMSTVVENNSNIPNVIHRTWYSKNMNNFMYEKAYLSWIKLNPNYTMNWYVDEDCELFMKIFGEKEYMTYKKIIPTAYKADLWRACKLYEEGGIYVDSYAVDFVSIDDMIKMTGIGNEKDIFISILDNSGIHNGLMMATPKHPFLKQYIQDIVDNVDKGKEDELFALTGPLCLSRSIDKVTGNTHRVGLNNVKYKYYLFNNDVGLYQSITNNGTLLLNKKYDFLYCILYQKVIKFSSSNYYYMYLTNQTCIQ